MIALLSALLGFGSSIFPKFFEVWQDKRDKSHELELMKYQLDIDKQRADIDLEKSLIVASAKGANAVQRSYQADMKANAKVGNPLMIALSASVRPVITYSFFSLYASIKCAQFYLMVNPALPWHDQVGFAQALVGIWTQEDMALFSAIICFWFGDRFVNKRK